MLDLKEKVKVNIEKKMRLMCRKTIVETKKMYCNSCNCCYWRRKRKSIMWSKEICCGCCGDSCSS